MSQTFQNHLSNESSPYLLQHAGNPVDWYPWSDEALAKAKNENRLLIISIGYAACHWCHVMERESFEDPAVADIMNRYYVSVKVDREERPDIDQVYMPAAYAVTGRGGWPLNVVALPDGRPVYAGTYFRKNDWLYLLEELASLYRQSPNELLQQARDIARKTEGMESLPMVLSGGAADVSSANSIFKSFERQTDPEHGGFHGAPKFPMPVNLDYIMQYGVLAENREALQFLELTLDRMGNGGIYDQLGGGFARYSTDVEWHVPHFEKMLYDNAQLISIYARGYRLFGKPEYAEIARSVIGFAERELRSPDGPFYSSLDADSNGEEGAFYCWNSGEIRSVCGSDYPVMRDFWDIREEGNWEKGRNVLRRVVSFSDLSERFRIPQDELVILAEKYRHRLLEERNRRIRPVADTKILTAWNSLMVSAYVDTAIALPGSDYSTKAETLASMLLEKSTEKEGKVFRLAEQPSGQRGRIPGFLDDYALLIRCLIDLYSLTFVPSWLEAAETITHAVLQHFYDDATSLFFYTSDTDAPLISRKKELGDNVIPSSNAVMAENLAAIGMLTGRTNWMELSDRMVDRMRPAAEREPAFHAGWTTLLLRRTVPDYLLCLVGSNWRKMKEKISFPYLPHVRMAGGGTESILQILKGKGVPEKTLAYICRENTCSPPMENPEEILAHLSKNIVRLNH